MVTTVEQENLATWKYREFQVQAICVQENFANYCLEDLLSFKVPHAYPHPQGFPLRICGKLSLHENLVIYSKW